MVVGEAGLLNGFGLVFGIKAFLVLFLVFNLVIALIIFRQIQLMDKKLPTPLAPFLRFASTVYIGLSAAILLLVIGVF